MALYESNVATAPQRRGLLAAFVARFRAWNERRLTRIQLEQLTDAQLNDIGLHRTQIDGLFVGLDAFQR